MTMLSADLSDTANQQTLSAYLLGLVDFEAALALQRLLVYQASEDRGSAALVVCEHPPIISVGRHGSRGHIHLEPDELIARCWRTRWINRGGGVMLHLPGQLSLYPIVPLDRLAMNVTTYLDRLHQVIIDVLADFHVRGQTRRDQPGVWVNGRPIALVGIAVRHWVSYFGVSFNVNPELEQFRRVRCLGAGERTMTSLERERRAPLRPAMVRERFLDHFASRFGFGRTALFQSHPLLVRQPLSRNFSAKGR
jgi:lipoyl(octanoyl) transferase